VEVLILNGFRIDPAPNGIHIVDTENGGERVFINNNEIDILIKELNKISSTHHEGVGV